MTFQTRVCQLWPNSRIRPCPYLVSREAQTAPRPTNDPEGEESEGEAVHNFPGLGASGIAALRNSHQPIK
ncbi:hypothetical protein J6590_054139 [Homalodisca vitripennis]|nr:hypothetical protein J6590_054139 [Homalodisca vitripennis]